MDDDLKETLERIEIKIDLLTKAVEALKGKGPKMAGEGLVKPSEKKVDDEVSELPDTSGRAKCPKCGSLKVTEMKDTKKPLSYSGGVPLYATKHVCNKCSHEW